MSAYLVVIAKATPFHYNTIQEKQEGTVLHVVNEPSWFGQVLPNKIEGSKQSPFFTEGRKKNSNLAE